MTNAEKYLKDGVDIKQFAEMIDTAYVKADKYADVCESTINWLKEQVKPTLTGDERVILRNIKNFTTIIRNIEGNIQVENNDGSFACLCAFNHLFQLIKVRRRIRNSRTIEIKYAHLPSSRQSLRTRTRKQTPCACADY